MLLTVALFFCLQTPQEIKPWVAQGQDPTSANAYTLSGTTELSAHEAWSSVTQRVVDDQRERLRDLAAKQAEATGSWWLPRCFRERAVQSWAEEQLRRYKPRVLDRELQTREHGGIGRSYQAFLLLEDVDAGTVTRTRGLARSLEREERRFLARCGGTVGLWGLLALVLGWIDRITRGYMTGRLWLIGGLLGLCGPIALVLL